jgi:hypothetical protein
VFPWAPYQQSKAAVQLHTLLDLRGPIPSFIHISAGQISEASVLDLLPPEPGAIYVMDRGYIDFARLHRLDRAGARFVIRDRANTRFRRRYSHPVDRDAGLICDQTIVFTGPRSAPGYPAPVRRIKLRNPDRFDRALVLLTNDTELPAATIGELYRCRWKIELFFKWIKQHLRIQAFFGTSENAVRTQIWIAVSVYVLIAIIKKRLGLDASLYTILQALSLTLFEKMPLDQVLANLDTQSDSHPPANQLELFAY